MSILEEPIARLSRVCLNKSVDLGKLLETYKVPILLGIVSIGLISISLILIVKSTQTSTPIVFSDEASVAGVLSGTIHIDIEGAVVNPGVYELSSGSRVEDAIVAAGGLSEEADQEKIAASINRAAKVVDGGKLFIPRFCDGGCATSQESPLYDVDADSSGLVNINFATQPQLEALPGIGPVTAQKIISNRPYQTLEELISKKAVGAALFDKIKNQLAL